MSAQQLYDYLQELNMASVCLRMFLGIAFGGFIGLERGSKQRAAGFRTYMLVCLGAVLTILLGQYEHHMLTTAWAYSAQAAGLKTDVARFGAQVISGIGFLGAGTIIVTGRQEVKGLTTGAGLWACACMGLAIGAGFYECVILSFVLIVLAIRILPAVESFVVDHARNMNLYVEFESLDDIGDIISCIKGLNAQIYQVDIDKGRDDTNRHPSAVFSIRLKKSRMQEKLLVCLSEIPNVHFIESI